MRWSTQSDSRRDNLGARVTLTTRCKLSEIYFSVDCYALCSSMQLITTSQHPHRLAKAYKQQINASLDGGPWHLGLCFFMTTMIIIHIVPQRDGSSLGWVQHVDLVVLHGAFFTHDRLEE